MSHLHFFAELYTIKIQCDGIIGKKNSVDYLDVIHENKDHFKNVDNKVSLTLLEDNKEKFDALMNIISLSIERELDGTDAK